MPSEVGHHGAGQLRVLDPTDGRARLVVFAERGFAALAVARHTEAAMQAEWTRHLGGRATAQLHCPYAHVAQLAGRLCVNHRSAGGNLELATVRSP